MLSLKIVMIFYLNVFATEALSDKLNSSELCLDCLENVATNRCNIPFCQSNSSCANKIDINKYSENIPEPTLVCRDENSLTLSWIPRDGMYYFVEYFRRQSNISSFSEFSRCNYLTINGLSSDETYSIVLYGILLGEKRACRSSKIIGQTSKVNLKRTPVKHLNYTLKLIENTSYTAIVEWEPGSDSSCLYEVVWYGKGEPGEYIHRRINLKKEPRTEFNLTNLEFGERYHFTITSIEKSGLSESPKRRLKILVPSCLDTFKNLTMCPPETPNNLTVTKIDTTSNQTNLELSWNSPKLTPPYYSISFFSSNGNPINDSFTLSLNISGDQHSTVLKNIQLGKYYQIKLTAYSKGGASKPAYIINNSLDTVDSSMTSTNGTTVIDDDDATVITNQAGKFVVWIWVATVAIVLIMVVLLFRQYIKDVIFKYLFFKEKIADDTVVRYTTSETEDSKWELIEYKLLIDKVIGFGAFGIVQKGYYYTESDKKTEVAVKTLKARPTAEQIAQFYDEIEIMKSVPRHAHIVFLIGVVTKHRPSNPLMLVEFCAGGDLQSFLRNVAFILADRNAEGTSELEDMEDGTKFFNKSYIDASGTMESKGVLESKDLMSFARQIVLGMEFLANLKVIHRDLAARNVLISGSKTLKISDFGLSRDIYTDSIYKKVTGGKLPFRWMALECLTHQIYTTESDVWSFGIVLWEIATLGANPYPTVNTEDLIRLLKNGYRMEKPINCSEELYEIMVNCWQTSPNLRATFKELREIFDKLLESEVQYISMEASKKMHRYENTQTELQDGCRG